jgi:DNA-binding transcriptional MerR regulator
MSVGDVAKALRVPLWQLRRLFSRGFLPPPPRCGQYRLLYADQLPEIRLALKRAGYLPPRKTAAAK